VSDHALLGAVERILDRGGDADDILRDAVDALHGQGAFRWAGISFLEEGALVLGPSSGVEAPGELVRVPIRYDGHVVADLGVIAADMSVEDRAVLDRVADLLAPYCLVGWDTGGEAWSP
jgi:putative methionine-R-sulfoxide reductase with GAF domain